MLIRTRRTTPTLVGGVLALALLVSACGQKPGVFVEGGPLTAGGAGGDGMGGGAEGELVDVDLDELGEPIEGDLGELGDLGDLGDGASGGGASGGDGGGASASAGAGGDGGGGEGGGRRAVRGSNRTGITDDRITLAVHAPVTGAAPLPATSFERARDLYWRWVIDEQGQDVLGRTEIDIIFADDKYEPSSAIQVCRQLASRAFLLAGAGGTDQIQACGQFAGQARIPYLSNGVTEAGLAGNPFYTAASMSYKQQGPLLAQYVRRNFAGQKVAAIVTQTRNFDDAVAGWEASLSGIDYAGTLRHPKGDTGWYATFARQLAQQDVDVVYMLTSPLDYIRFAQTANDQGLRLQYVGVGITKGLDDILGSGCPQVDGGVFFSPFPSLELADRLDPEFRQAARRFNVPVDDIAWAIWATSRFQHELFELYERTYGDDLTREDFADLLASSNATVSTGIFPDVQLGRDFGARATHVLRADCGSGRHRDAGTFQTSF